MKIQKVSLRNFNEWFFRKASAMILFGSCLLPIVAFSQIIPAPTIQCVTTDENSGDVTINWTNPPLNPCGPFVSYVLLGATSSSGPFLTIDTIFISAQTTTIHAGANATILDWYYFMTMVQNCPGATQTFSDTIQEEPLITPDLDFVTVTDTGVYIKWFPSPSTQTAGYIIYYDLGGGLATEADTVFGRLTDDYIDINANPNAARVVYTIAAFDGCLNKTLFNENEHNTIFLGGSIQQCTQQVTLDWNQYINWSGVSGYRIETSLDGAPFTVAQTLPDGSTQYLYSLVGVTGDTLCFRITAVHQNGTTTSTSNVRCLPLNLVRSTTFNYLRNVSVNQAGGVDLEWYIDTSADINSYYVLRSLNGNTFTSIDTLPVVNPAFLNTYTDAQANTSVNSFHYEVASFDDCNFQLNSTKGQTIFLEGKNNGILNELEWNAFSLENATVLDYTIYRVENGVLVPLQTFTPSTLTFEDDISTAISEDGAFCYVIEASFNLSIPGFVNENLTSRSNQLCLYQKPVIYVPNAFVPGGKNNVFKPTLLNPNISEYEFLIFDRWGKQLFTTDVLAAGWDGTNNGEEMPMGGYSYYIKVVSKGGEAQEKTGMVVLVR